MTSQDMTAYDQVQLGLVAQPKAWAITGIAGFIGSNLLEALLKLDQHVAGLDNFSTGHQHNLDEVRARVSPAQWARFVFVRGDICDVAACRNLCANTDYVLHQAALDSVPRSLEDPIATNAANVTGFLNMLVAARDAGVRRFVYAASSSTYGDHPGLPMVEDGTGKPLSPYALTKYVNELYAEVFARVYKFQTIGLRYFNIFGARQDPEGAYAAVIPKWIDALMKGQSVFINGDGETSRDFCYIANTVQANLLAATTQNPQASNQVYNVAVGDRTTLNDLFSNLQRLLLPDFPQVRDALPVYLDFRAGDVRHSQADISMAANLLGFSPTHRFTEGLGETVAWYRAAEPR